MAEIEFFKGLTEFRNRIFEQQGESLKYLGKVIRDLKKLNPTEEEVESLLLTISLISDEYKRIGKLSDRLVERINHNKFIDKLSIHEKQILIDHNEMAQYIFNGLFELDYPFKIDRDSKLIDEFEYYQIQNGDRIGEIGAGNGLFAKIVASIYTDVTIYVNELSSDHYNVFSKEFNADTALFKKSNNIFPIKGEVESARLEGKELNKIIVRSALHHFSSASDMLKSIAKSLHPSGKVYFLERPLDHNSESRACYYAWKRKRIIKALNHYGLSFQNEIKLELGQSIFVCKKSKDKKF